MFGAIGLHLNMYSGADLQDVWVQWISQYRLHAAPEALPELVQHLKITTTTNDWLDNKDNGPQSDEERLRRSHMTFKSGVSSRSRHS